MSNNTTNITSLPLRRFATQSKPSVVIRRPVNIKPHPRARLDEDDDTAPDHFTASMPADLGDSMDALTTRDDGDIPDELTRIRALLRPPPIPGVEDWGIPPESTSPCNPDVEVIIERIGYVPSLGLDVRL